MSPLPNISNVLQVAISTRRTTQSGVVQGGLISPVLFTVYMKDMRTPYIHVELALYADDTALTATSRSPSHAVGYLETYLSRFEHCLHDLSIAIVSKCTAVLLAKIKRCVQNPRPVQLFGGPIQRFQTAGKLGQHLLPG
jgi:retron-type reverse transcriptase